MLWLLLVIFICHQLNAIVEGGNNITNLTFGVWNDSASVNWSPNDRYGAFDFHGLFNPNFNLYDPVTLKKSFLVPSADDTGYEDNQIRIGFTIFFGCSVDDFETMTVNVTFNGENRFNLEFNTSDSHFVENDDNPWPDVCSWHTAGNLENQIWRGNWDLRFNYNKTQVETDGRLLSLAFFTDFNHDTRDEFWAVGNVSITISPQVPTTQPTQMPSNYPTYSPTDRPTNDPTKTPSMNPTFLPSISPTNEPTDKPTPLPTFRPTKQPNTVPTEAPVPIPTGDPSSTPTNFPSTIPTGIPTNDPTQDPTDRPTISPSTIPSSMPTTIPSKVPSNNPVPAPTDLPTFSSKYCHSYSTNWKNWDLLQNKNDLSVFIPNDINETNDFWIKMRDESIVTDTSPTNWLVQISTIYSFDYSFFDKSDTNGNAQYFQVYVDSEWSNEKANPVFAISDSRSYVAVQISGEF